FAMEHMPEAFIPVHMLFIRMKINNCPVIAFIDSGAQTSILSESCAKRCNVIRMVDKRIRVQAVGIGGNQKMLGRIHSCQVQVNEHFFSCPFEVMADRDIDILFGLNTLLRHKCSIDLIKMVLRFGDGTEAPFLSEAEFQREKEAVILNEKASIPSQGSLQKITFNPDSLTAFLFALSTSATTQPPQPAPVNLAAKQPESRHLWTVASNSGQLHSNKFAQDL
uniref:Aspartic peptidase DDI1-type domain-containing protein n=1 Tax=Meloidogyne javanica TaxID=6303 RepID=A0A915N4H8_MELJA